MTLKLRGFEDAFPIAVSSGDKRYRLLASAALLKAERNARNACQGVTLGNTFFGIGFCIMLLVVVVLFINCILIKVVRIFRG